MAIMSGKAAEQETLDELYANLEKEQREALKDIPVTSIPAAFKFKLKEDAVLQAAKALWDSPGHCVVGGSNMKATLLEEGFWMDARIWISSEDVANYQNNTAASKPAKDDMPF